MPNTTPDAPAIQWVLFDWGNVLCEYRPRGFPKLAAVLGVELDALATFITDSGLLGDLGCGRVSPDAALSRLAERFGRHVSYAEACACFRQDVERELPGIRDVLQALRPRVRLGVLSNTFFGHWDHFERSELKRYFDAPMASHLLGASKPDAAIYRAALRQIGAPAGAVLFIDDKLQNVEAARAVGMRAVHSQSVAQTRAGLVAHGL